MSKSFFADEHGAVTVDWVVLTAALVGLGLAVMTVVGDGINSSANAVADEMADDESIMAAANISRFGGFNISGYTAMGDWSHFGDFGGYLDHIAETDTSGNYNWDTPTLTAELSLYSGNAANTGSSLSDRQFNADAYVGVYSELESRGEDLSGHPDPEDVIASAT